MKNKTNTLLCFLSLLVSGTAFGQDLYSSVTNLWWNGPKTNILAIADERLSANTNDIVGIVLRMEGEWAFGSATTISNATLRFLSVGATIQTPAFRVQYPQDAYDVAVFLESMPEISMVEWNRERELGANLRRKMKFDEIWDALHDDGWLDAVPPSNVFSRQGVESRMPRQRTDVDIFTGKLIVAYMVYCSTRSDENLEQSLKALPGLTDTQILAQAQQRPADAPDDLFGATTSLLYHFKRGNPRIYPNAVDRISILSNEVERVLQIGSTETKPAFATHWPWMSTYLGNVQIWLSSTDAPAFEAALHYDDLHGHFVDEPAGPPSTP